MKAVVAYIASDGRVHVWDAANRGDVPLCLREVFMHREAKHAWAMNCADCTDMAFAGFEEVGDWIF
jgi:hypothetical protein